MGRGGGILEKTIVFLFQWMLSDYQFSLMLCLDAWNTLVTNLIFSQASNFSFLYSEPTLVQGESTKTKNQTTNKKKSDKKKYKHMQGHNKSLLETGYRFRHPKNVRKHLIKVSKMNKSVAVLKVYLCAFGVFQQTKLISLRRNSINMKNI